MKIWGIVPGVAPRLVVFVLLKSWDKPSSSCSWYQPEARDTPDDMIWNAKHEHFALHNLDRSVQLQLWDPDVPLAPCH